MRRDAGDATPVKQRQELDGRNLLVVANHQWLVGELSQLTELVAGFRRKLSECTVATRSADTG